MGDRFSTRYEVDNIYIYIYPRQLNVLLPDYITRISEYIPEVVEYIKNIISNGFAYESNGSVYFDIANFKKAGYQYSKLEPTSVTNEQLVYIYIYIR